MSLWLVRAGKFGDQEQGALDQNVVAIGWNELPNLTDIKSRQELTKLFAEVYPTASKNKAANEVGQVWRFVSEIRKGDIVALPLKTRAAIAIGEVKSDYKYEKLAENIKHIRRVKWLKTVPRSSFDQDLLYSLGAFMTVCQISRNDAENRVRKILRAEVIPGANGPVGGEIDIEEYSQDEIVKHIARRFKGHDLARLVEAILKAQGYVTSVSTPGPDGGVDILGAKGALGFDAPRICVQVKSAAAPIDVRVIRELQGVVGKTGADQGLLVAWGGFTNKAIQEAKDSFFSLRLWDQGELLEALFKHYESFDDELKAELTLKRIWSLVVEAE